MSAPLRHAGLFEGYGGTSQAAAMALGELDTVWVSDIKPAAVELLAARHPGVPNLGDMTALDYTAVAAVFGPIDVLTASWPCQPHSSAGKRLGEKDPRALWPHVARAIAETRPALFLGENVARIAGNGELRRVVRSLAHLGYVGAWRVLRASDVGACHRRERCFVVAVDPAAFPGRAEHKRALPEVGPLGRIGTHIPATQPAGGDRDPRLTLLPTPTQNMTTGAGTSGRDGGKGGPGMRGSSGDLALPSVAVRLLPTPNARMGKAGTPDRELAQARLDSGRRNLQDAVGAHLTPEPTLLPTPSASNYGTNQGGAAGRVGTVRESLDTMARHERFTVDWGVYAEAIARWDCVFGRPAPAPTIIGAKGTPQLSPHFVEWCMGLPEGWVCGPDIADRLAPRATGWRNACLSLLGDGVVPQQGAAAYRFLLGHLAARLAAGVAA